MSRHFARLLGLLFACALPAAGSELAQGLAAFRAGDWIEAFTRLSPLAEAGDGEAAFALGEMYARGQGVVADPELARDCYRRAAARGVVPAMLALASLLEARGGEEDLAEAENWLKEAVHRGSREARLALGLYYLRVEPRRDFTEAARFLAQAALAGDANAQYFLGRLFLDGRGVPRDEGAGKTWLARAAAQGHQGAARYAAALERANEPDRSRHLRQLQRQLAAGTARLTGVAEDEAYGRTRAKPIRPGQDVFALWAYLNALRGPHGEPVDYHELAPCCFFVHPDAPRGRAWIERYAVQVPGLDAPVVLYFDLFHAPERLVAPAGFTYVTEN